MRPVCVAAAAVLTAGSVSVVAAPSASAAGCEAETIRTVVQTSVDHPSVGSVAGKYNAAPSRVPLTYDQRTTTTVTSSWTAGSGASVALGIAAVEGGTGRHVVRTFAKGTPVTQTLSVPGRSFGYLEPTVEVRTFHVYDMRHDTDCAFRKVKDDGYFSAITAAPVFARCAAATECTPSV